METPNLIALIALLVSLLALPMSYFVAIRQVKAGLNEHDRRTNKRLKNRVADAIDEFVKVFFGATEAVTGIKPAELHNRQEELSRQIGKVEDYVLRTGVLKRLAASIDELAEVGFDGLKQSNDLQMVRNKIEMGSQPEGENYVAWSVLNMIMNLPPDLNLQAQLRKL